MSKDYVTSTDATKNFDCPKCGAKAGERCIQPNGKKLPFDWPHLIRFDDYARSLPQKVK